jgi:ABC-2 type transport system permease protein
LFGSYSVFFFIVSFGVFSLQNVGNFIPLFIITFILLISVINISVFIASFFHRKIVALQFLTLTSYPIFLISGYSWPYSSLPTFLKLITNTLPSTPYFAAFTRVTQMGASLREIFPEVIHLLILAVAGNVLAYYRIKFLSNKSMVTEMLPQTINNKQSIMR